MASKKNPRYLCPECLKPLKEDDECDKCGCLSRPCGDCRYKDDLAHCNREDGYTCMGEMFLEVEKLKKKGKSK